MTTHGFLRVAAAVPTLRVADCDYNAERILDLLARAERDGVAVVVFPELCLTGYTCADMFHQFTLQRGALAALNRVARASATV
jgi:NAD+ synthase (glutamine-hydrolysing)